MSKYQESFPVLSIDREDINHAVGYELGPELSNEQMKQIASKFDDALQALKPWNILADVMDSIVVLDTAPSVATQPKHLDTTSAAKQMLQDFERGLRQIQDGITNIDGVSFACFPFGFSQGNRTCRGEDELKPNSPVCKLCRELHGYNPEYLEELKEYESE